MARRTVYYKSLLTAGLGHVDFVKVNEFIANLQTQSSLIPLGQNPVSLRVNRFRFLISFVVYLINLNTSPVTKQRTRALYNQLVKFVFSTPNPPRFGAFLFRSAKNNLSDKKAAEWRCKWKYPELYLNHLTKPSQPLTK